uniref:WRKY transcription factor 30 n=1 Tax=Santalum album TaxID=35974 RepID=A0A650C354_SANAL|nr:WRKY transcription factor 30 [Santalum album]
MDTSKEVVSDMPTSDILEQSPKPDLSTQKIKPIQEEIPHILNSGNDVSDIDASDRLPQSNNQEENICLESSRNGSVHEAKSNQEGTTEVTLGDGVSNEVASDKSRHSQNPNLRALEVEVSREAIVPTTLPEKALEDGYNWRKYGQKHVKGNEFIRGYYKCTHPTCQVKKQVERTHDGQIMDTLYIGTHDHPKAQHTSVAAASVLSIQEDKTDESLINETEGNAHVLTSHLLESTDAPKSLTVAANEADPVLADSRSNKSREGDYNNENPEPKRRKQDCRNVDATQADKQAGESRLVRTMNEAETVNDGYRWRKYGQKFVKGNPNPRSYYRCSNAGCPVKKHVEKASHDPKLVIATYEGQHDHDMPPSRTVTPNVAGSNSNAAALNGDLRTESEESDIVGHEVIVQYSLHPESRSSKHCRPDTEPVHS